MQGSFANKVTVISKKAVAKYILTINNKSGVTEKESKCIPDDFVDHKRKRAKLVKSYNYLLMAWWR